MPFSVSFVGSRYLLAINTTFYCLWRVSLPERFTKNLVANRLIARMANAMKVVMLTLHEAKQNYSKTMGMERMQGIRTAAIMDNPSSTSVPSFVKQRCAILG